MSAKSYNIYFHLGTAFMILMIVVSAFLLAIIWEASTNLVPNNGYFDDYMTDLPTISDRNVISICCAWGEELADGELTFMIRDNDDYNQDDISRQDRE